MSDRSPSLSMVMPTYNEEPGLEEAVLHTHKALTELGLDFEIIIVDDQSADGTAQIAKELSQKLENVSAYRHMKNQGIGGAFKTGISHAGKEFVMLIPVDNPLNSEEILAFISRMSICDIVVGVRVERVGYSTFSKFCSFTYNRVLVPLLFNIGISDVNWIQAYRLSLFRDKTITITCNGIFFLVEILVHARRARLVIVEVPSSMRRRLYGTPTSHRPKVILGTFRDMVDFFIDINLRNQKP